MIPAWVLQRGEDPAFWERWFNYHEVFLDPDRDVKDDPPGDPRFTCRFDVGSGHALVLDANPLSYLFDLALADGTSIAWDDDAHPIPDVLRWGELDEGLAVVRGVLAHLGHDGRWTD